MMSHRYKLYLKRFSFVICHLLVGAVLLSCDHISEADRLIEVEDELPENPDLTAIRNVLLEDFTGQRCPNCPTGTEVIEQLQEAYGERLVAVGIHGGPLGFKGTPTVVGLATDVGDTYYQHWNLEYQPVGLVNRHGALNYTEWVEAVRTEMARESLVEMEMVADLVGDKIDITVREEAFGDFTGMLQVWLLEDGITALQTMPDGKNNREYVHNHVLRTPVNGIWGEAFTIGKGDQKSQTFTQAVDAAWNTDNLSAVAFIYNASGVEQVVKMKVEH